MDPATTAKTIRALTEPYQTVPGGLLPALWNIQNTLGYIPDEHLSVIADTLNLSRAEVHGVVSFYHDFRSNPVRHCVKICGAEACQAMGARQLMAAARAATTNSNCNDIELRSVYCLGLCANAPAAMINGELYAGLSEAKLTERLSTLASGQEQASE